MATDLFNLGYATGDPRIREATLNEEYHLDSHLGSFSVMHAIAIQDSYNGEQALFRLLADHRVWSWREFFVLPLADIRRAMELVAAQFDGDRPAPRAEFAAPAPWAGLNAMREQTTIQVDVPDRVGRHGWVMAFRNEFYRQGILKLSSTRGDPLRVLDEINTVQRERTCRVGLFKLVGCWACDDPDDIKRGVVGRFRGKLPAGQRSFVDASLADLHLGIQDAIDFSVRGGSGNRPAIEVSRSAGETASPRPRTSRRGTGSGAVHATAPLPTITPVVPIGVKKVTQRNTCPHDTCLATVVAEGEIGAVGRLRCGSCRRPVGYEIGEAPLLLVWQDNH